MRIREAADFEIDFPHRLVNTTNSAMLGIAPVNELKLKSTLLNSVNELSTSGIVPWRMVWDEKKKGVLFVNSHRQLIVIQMQKLQIWRIADRLRNLASQVVVVQEQPDQSRQVQRGWNRTRQRIVAKVPEIIGCQEPENENARMTHNWLTVDGSAGIAPLSWLLSKKMNLSCDNRTRSAGILPTRLLLPKILNKARGQLQNKRNRLPTPTHSDVSAVSLVISFEIDECSWFPLKCLGKKETRQQATLAQSQGRKEALTIRAEATIWRFRSKSSRKVLVLATSCIDQTMSLASSNTQVKVSLLTVLWRFRSRTRRWEAWVE
jgi:hypothetical protein